MGAVISNLKARFGVDTGDFKKGLKDGEKAVDDFKGAAGNSISELAGMFGINMSAVNEALETSRRSMNFLSQSFKAGAGGANILAVAMKVLRVALISTGIGALIVALGSLIAYFKGTGEGADKFRVIMAQLRSVIDNLVDRLQSFGSGLVDIFSGRFKDGVEKIRGAFKGMGAEIREDLKISKDLAVAENELYRRETELVTSLEERRQKMEELRLVARDQDKTLQEQQAAQAAAMKLLESMTKDQVGLEEERLRIMQEKLRISATDPTREQLREIADQEAKISQLKAGEARQMRELIEYYNTVTRKIEEAANAQEKLASEAEKAWQAMINKGPATTGKLFDIEKIKSDLAEVNGALVSAATSFQQSMADALNQALGQMISNVAFALGELAAGTGGIKDVGQVILGTLADLAKTVGELLIKAGLASLALFQALQFPNPANAAIAIAAGAALIAISGMVKGAMSRAAGGGSVATASAAASGGYTFDTRNLAGMKQEIEITGKLTADGRELAYVFNKEDQRIRSTTGGLRR